MRYRDKLDWIRRFVGNRRILYIGSVDDNRENIHKHDTFFKILSSLSDNVSAVYHSQAEVFRLKEMGLNAVCADPEKTELGEEYELILAVDNIEHMSNCGRFIQGISRHLSSGGLLLITTPNPASLVRIGELFFSRRDKANPEHTCWFTPQVLDQLARRYGLHVVEEVYIDEMYQYHRSKDKVQGLGWLTRVSSWILMAFNYVICLLLPQFCETYGCALTRET